jgi:hypothetical protein
MSDPSPLWVYYSINVWWRVWIMKLLIMQFSPTSFYLLRLKSKYSQHLVLFLNILNLCFSFN